MEFDLNLVLVPVTLFFLLILLVDRLYLKKHKHWDKQQLNLIISWSHDLLPVFAFILVLRTFVIEPFNIPSASMKPTLFTGDFILVNKVKYGIKLPILNKKIIPISEPKRGDVVVFRFPNNPKLFYIKRVIGLAGDEIENKHGVLSVNGVPLSLQKNEAFRYQQDAMNKELDYSTIFNETIDGKTHTIRDLNGISVDAKASFIQLKNPNINVKDLVTTWKIKVPKGNYFVLGDNRDQSEDSRFWGFVPAENLIGNAFYVWMHKRQGMKLPNFSSMRSIQ